MFIFQWKYLEWMVNNDAGWFVVSSATLYMLNCVQNQTGILSAKEILTSDLKKNLINGFGKSTEIRKSVPMNG